MENYMSAPPDVRADLSNIIREPDNSPTEGEGRKRKDIISQLEYIKSWVEFSGKELMRRTNALRTVVAKEAKDLSELRNLHEQQGVELRKFHEEQGVRMDQLCELCLSFETTLANIDGKLDGLAESFANRAADPGAPPQERAERDPQLVFVRASDIYGLEESTLMVPRSVRDRFLCSTTERMLSREMFLYLTF